MTFLELNKVLVDEFKMEVEYFNFDETNISYSLRYKLHNVQLTISSHINKLGNVIYMVSINREQYIMHDLDEVLSELEKVISK